jgi:hypothetical protein
MSLALRTHPDFGSRVERSSAFAVATTSKAHNTNLQRTCRRAGIRSAEPGRQTRWT